MLLAFFFLSLSSCISRLGRPAMSGTVLGYDNQPISGCVVGETVTDSNGKFYLKEIRYNTFFLSEMFIMEAPPLHVEERIEKPGYKALNISIHHTFGGGRRKGAHFPLDTIFLKKVDEEIAAKDVIFAKWTFNATKDVDTLYAINNNFRQNNSNLHDGSSFFRVMSYGLQYLYQAPKPVDTAWTIDSYSLETTGVLELRANGSYRSTVVKTYHSPWQIKLIYEDRTRRRSISLPNDTLIRTGNFIFADSEIKFSNGIVNQKTRFKIDSLDRDVMALSLIK